MARKEQFLFNQLFGDQVPNADELAENDPLKIRVREITQLFDAGVDTLRNPERFPNKKINELMTLFWHLVGSKITSTATIEGLESMSFWG